MDQTAYTDADSAHTQFAALLAEVAASHDWTDAERLAAEMDEASAYAEASPWWWTNDVHTYWSSLAKSSPAWTGPNADKLRAVIASASGTVIAEQERAAAESVVTQATGTAEATADDVTAAAEKTADAVSSPYFWPAVGAFVVLVAVVAVKVR